MTDLLLHPVRLRIIQAASDGEAFTTADLCVRLPDVSRATIYRQVALLSEGELLEVVDEQQVRGAIERRYRLSHSRAVLNDEAVRAMSLDDHRKGFAAVMASLLAEFELYLGEPGVDPAADTVSYKQLSLWLSPQERADLIDQVRALLRDHAGNAPSPEREQHLLSTIMFPRRKPGG